MTEDVKDTKLEDIQDTVETPPVPTPSATSPEKASEQPQVDVSALAKAVAKEMNLEGLVDARFKKTTDPRFADVRKVAEYLEKAGGDVEAAAKNMVVDQIVEREMSREASQPAAGGGEDAGVTERMTKYARRVLSNAGIDWDNNADYAALLREVNENWDTVGEYGFYDRLDNFADNYKDKATKQSSVGMGAVVGSGGKTVAPTDDEGLLDRIVELQKHPVANATKIKELMAEARKRELLPK